MNDSLYFIVACFMKIPLPTLVFQLMHRTWRLCPQTLMECTCRVGLGKYMGGEESKGSQEKGKDLANAYTIASRLKNVICCQCYFRSKKQVLMAVSNIWVLGIISQIGVSFFSGGEGSLFSGGASFLGRKHPMEGIYFDREFSKKNLTSGRG